MSQRAFGEGFPTLPPLSAEAELPSGPLSSHETEAWLGEGSDADVEGSAEPALVVGKFRILQRLAPRSHALVYEAFHTGTERRVQLHMVPSGLSTDSPVAEEMLRAARAAGRVPHPHILGVVDSDTDAEGRPFLVYEHFSPHTCLDLVEHVGPLPVTRAAEVMCQLLDALAALHKRGVVHRQIRPEHILVDDTAEELRIKLTGFGYAAVPGMDVLPALPRGYSRYAAPEVRRRQNLATPAMDIYAAGVLMRYLLTGDSGGTFGLDGRSWRAIARATAEDPEERFLAAEHFMSAVGLLLQSEGAADSAAPQDRLAADLRYMQRIRERDSGVIAASESPAHLHWVPVLMMIEGIYGKLGAEGWQEILSEVPQAEQLLPAAGLGEKLRAQGVPLSLVSKLLRVADRVGGSADLSWLAGLGESMAKRGLPRFCKGLPQQMSPEALVDCIGGIWSSLAYQGEVSILDRGDRFARVAVRNESTPSLELCALFAGLLRGQLRTLSTTGDLSVVASEALGDAADIFVLTWR